MTEKSVLPPKDENLLSIVEPRLDFLLLTELNEQSSLSSSSDPRNLAERILRGYTVKIKKGTKRVTLHKFLLAKLLLDEGGLHLDEFIVLNEIHFDLMENCERDFLLAHSEYLIYSGKLLSQVALARAFPLVTKVSPTDEQLRSWHLPTKREYFGLRGQRDLKKSFKLILADTVVPQKLPPERYIGVGYKDKGTCRQPERDGSQSWQEIGAHFSNLEREAEDSSFTEETLVRR
jgi:hypothetical protein